MSQRLAEDYDLTRLVRVKAARFGFDLFTLPSFVRRYSVQAYEEMTALLIRQNACGVRAFVDVGAHHGFYTLLVGLRNPDCRILAFEPVAENIEIVRRNLALNGLGAETFSCAAADRAGSLPFYVSQASDRSGLAANPTAPILRTCMVQTVRLDEFLDRLAPGPALVKIDVEGAEVGVLRGMSGLFAQIEDLRIVLEFNPHCLEANGVSPQSLLSELVGLGYVAFALREEERRYEQVDPGRDWRDLMGNRGYVNLFCQRKRQSLNLCLFSPSSDLVGGPENSLLELTGNLVGEHASLCTVVLPRRGSLAEALEDRGIPTLFLEADPWWWPASVPADAASACLHRSYYRLRFFLPQLQRLSPDLVLTDSAALPWGAVAAVLLNRPHVWMIRELDNLAPEFANLLGRLMDTIREASNHVVVGSEGLRSTFFGGMDQAKCSLAYPAHIELPIPQGTISPVFRQPHSLKLYTADAILPANGAEDVLSAVAKLTQLGYSLEVCLAGGLSEHDAAKRVASRDWESCGLSLHFPGSPAHARGFLQEADIGLSFSRSWSPGRAVIEAMLLGKPVISTNTSGAAELIQDGVNGLLYAAGDSEQLAQKFRFFLDHHERIGQFGDRARQDILSKLDDHPDDWVITRIARTLRGQPNPYSSRLLRLMLEWEHGEGEAEYLGQIERLERRARHAEVQLAAREREFQAIQRTRAWRFVRLYWKAKARLVRQRRVRRRGRN